jgi:predicted ATPase/DNA-binding SARP family transcriptional activator
VEVELLGPPGLRDEDGPQPVAGRQRALLAALALRARRPVPGDHLVEVVWGDELPADPANALQQRISALRRLVDPDRRGDVLVAGPGGYTLHLDDDAIDARRFERLAGEGARLREAGDVEAAVETLGAGLALWRGPALDGVADEPWARGDVARLEERRLTAIEDRVEALLALARSGRGSPGALAPELAALVEANPLRERLTGALIEALYRAGRQGEALERYEGLRRRLLEELGVDPSPALQALHRRVLTQDPALTAGTEAVGPSAGPGAGDASPGDAPPTADARRGNLPARTTPVIGRDEALPQVDELLSRGRLVTLTGPGGAGKTTLALEAARRLDPPLEGGRLVELATVAGEAAVLAAIARGLDVRAGGIGSRGLDLDRLVASLADRELVVVLDNCEHVVSDVARIVERLVTAAPGVRVLATSREVLGVGGEVVWSVPALDVPGEDATTVEEVLAAPAVRLLVDRARQVVPGFALGPDDAPLAGTLVRRLDGIPLAIELAAARLRVLSLPEVVEGLADRFALLRSRDRHAPSRQRTLRGALDWSHDLLDDDQRRAWAALSVPSGWFDRHLAAALLEASGIEADPLELLTELADRSLLTVDTAARPARYRLLETVRAYGRERLADLPGGDAVNERHADAVEAALLAAHRPDDEAAFGIDLATLATWSDEARGALQWAEQAGDRPRVQRLAGLLGWHWLLQGLATEGLGWLERGLADVRPDTVTPATSSPDAASPNPASPAATPPDPLAVTWLVRLGLARPGPIDERWVDVALALAPTPAERVVTSVFVALGFGLRGRPDACVELLEASRADAERIGGWPLGFLELFTAQFGRVSGQVASVRHHAERALELCTATGVDWARAYAIDIVIDALDEQAERDRRLTLAREGLTLSRAIGVTMLESRMLVHLGTALQEDGASEEARAALARAVALGRAEGPTPGLGFTLLAAGAAARQRGDAAEALTYLDEAVGLLDGGGTPPFGTAWALVERSRAAGLAGARDRAVADAARALALAEALGDPGLLDHARTAARDADDLGG